MRCRKCYNFRGSSYVCDENGTLMDPESYSCEKFISADKFHQIKLENSSNKPRLESKGSFESDLDEVLSEIRSFLLEKNKAYGDSALNPIRAFSKADPIEQIKVRIDDKLSRFVRGNSYPGDNDEKDFCGYSILLQVARLRERRGGSK